MEQLFFSTRSKSLWGAGQNVSKKGYSSTFVQIVSKQKKLHSFSAKSVTHFARVIKVQNLSRVEPCN